MLMVKEPVCFVDPETLRVCVCVSLFALGCVRIKILYYHAPGLTHGGVSIFLKIGVLMFIVYCDPCIFGM